jgi:hypothetical protein
MRRQSNSERAAWTALIDGKPAGSRTMALGRLKVGERNRTEAAYESHLEMRRRVGEILWYDFERMTFRLADDTRFTPDFNLLLANGILECHEVKGTTTRDSVAGKRKAPYILDDARVKVRVAAELFPIVFKIVYLDAGNWIELPM